MDQLLLKIQKDNPHIIFETGDSACWSPQDQKVFYRTPFGEKEFWALCHEIGHAQLCHKSFDSDVDLLQKEIAAWLEAENIAKEYGLIIDSNHIEDCLDSYRDWLHKRSACPNCQTKGIQSKQVYSCFNCNTSWHVTPSRSCRPYRRTLDK